MTRVFSVILTLIATPLWAGNNHEVSPTNILTNGKDYQIHHHSASVATGPVVLYELEDGRLALPRGFALMPGDEELWYQMDRFQQDRAIAFLASGSTIRSSLGWD